MMSSKRTGIGRAVLTGIIIVILVVAAVAVYLAATSGTSTTSSTPISSTIQPSSSSSSSSTTGPPQQLKIAVIGSGPSTAYFAEFNYAGVAAAAQALSTPQLQITVTAAYNVASSQIISVCQQYVSEGYKIFYFYVDYAATYYQIAQAVPNAFFIDEYLTPNGYNSSTFNYQNPESNNYKYNVTNTVGWAVDLSGAYYVAGVAGALVSQTHKLGYDGAFNIAALAYWYNNFAMGAHSVDNSIPVYYGFTNDWTDPTKGAAVTDSLISRGADVIAPAGDTQSIGSTKEAVSKNVYGVGYPVNLNNFSARYMLGSVYFNATGTAYTILHDYLTNNVQGHYYDLDMAHHGVAFILNPGLASAGVVTSSMQTQINTAVSDLVSYKVTLSQDANFPPQPT